MQELWLIWSVTHTLAYYATEHITVVNLCISQAPVPTILTFIYCN
jgi:hypothetical protein